LLKAIEGLVVMGSALEIARVSLQYQKVPQMWEAAAYPSLKPLGSWLTDLEARITFIDEVRGRRSIEEGHVSTYTTYTNTGSL
jgi:dynein heavy chain